MKGNTVEVSGGAVKAERKKGSDTTLTRSADREKEFVCAMNIFVTEHGVITDDEFFRVL